MTTTPAPEDLYSPARFSIGRETLDPDTTHDEIINALDCYSETATMLTEHVVETVNEDLSGTAHWYPELSALLIVSTDVDIKTIETLFEDTRASAVDLWVERWREDPDGFTDTDARYYT